MDQPIRKAALAHPGREREDEHERRDAIRREDLRIRERNRSEDMEFRAQQAAAGEQARVRESRLATRRFALLAASQNLGVAADAGAVTGLAERYIDWIDN